MFEFFQGFGVTFSTMFKKVVTEEYPEDFPPAAPRYHCLLYTSPSPRDRS